MARKETKRELMLAACNALVDAYRAGMDNGGSIRWVDVDIAASFAAKATGRKLDPEDD